MKCEMRLFSFLGFVSPISLVSLHVAEEEARQGFVLPHFVCLFVLFCFFSLFFFFFFGWEVGVWLCCCVGNVREDLVLYIL
jgi:hypothetical protein